MATNNSVNLNGNGAVKYDGAGTFSAAAVPLVVSNQGTGDASLTAYAVLCGGTTSTGNVQSIAGVGSSAQILTSNGSASLPTFQAVPGSRSTFTATFSALNFNPADNTTYYILNNQAPSTTHTTADYRFYFTGTGSIQKAYGFARIAATPGSNENVTIFIRLNNTTNTNITTTTQWTSGDIPFNNPNLSISVAAGDYIEVGITTPTWGTNPLGVFVDVSVFGYY
jgi:hypothetical protein